MAEVIKSNLGKENKTPIRYVTDQIYALLVDYMMDICHKKTDETGEKIKFSKELKQQMKKRKKELQKVFEDYYFSPTEQRTLLARLRKDKQLTGIVKDNSKAIIEKGKRQKGRYFSSDTYDFLKQVASAYHKAFIPGYIATSADYDIIENLVTQMNLILTKEGFTEEDLYEILSNVEREDFSHFWCYHPHQKAENNNEFLEGDMEIEPEESYSITPEIYKKLTVLVDDLQNMMFFKEIDDKFNESIKARFSQSFDEIKEDLKSLGREDSKIDTFLRKLLTGEII